MSETPKTPEFEGRLQRLVHDPVHLGSFDGLYLNLEAEFNAAQASRIANRQDRPQELALNVPENPEKRRMLVHQIQYDLLNTWRDRVGDSADIQIFPEAFMQMLPGVDDKFFPRALRMNNANAPKFGALVAMQSLINYHGITKNIEATRRHAHQLIDAVLTPGKPKAFPNQLGEEEWFDVMGRRISHVQGSGRAFIYARSARNSDRIIRERLKDPSHLGLYEEICASYRKKADKMAQEQLVDEGGYGSLHYNRIQLLDHIFDMLLTRVITHLKPDTQPEAVTAKLEECLAVVCNAQDCRELVNSLHEINPLL